ncbi:primase C-terminal domain-containing protein [Listeria booriae]|uniref:primase C-terminal domain-containing protein n=1 Tax=Listeria booriae TaxID=1552123 RepID=UPI001625805C|nr:hypothetical protein [Listeria booriae]
MIECDHFDDFPKCLNPTSLKTNHIGDLSEGDGHNDALFTYILTLQSEGMSKDEIRESIRTINDFILKEPISDNELNIILFINL